MPTKSLTMRVKDADAGVVEAVFATLNVKDSDWDVTVPGAFENGAEVLISAYGHKSWSGELPVGMGTIESDEKEAVFTGNFWLDTLGGGDTFKVVKRSGKLQEWSYGYDAVKYSYGEHEGDRVRFLEQIKVHEVSPVMRGAGVGTRTLSAKSGLKFSDEAEAVLTAVQELTDRAADVMAKRQEKNGKSLGVASAELMTQVHDAVKRLDEVLRAEAPAKTDSDADLQHECLRFLRFTSPSV